MYDRAKFFASIRSLSAHFSQSQIDGFNAVLDVAPPALPKAHLAYCLATAWHETAATMKPIEEYGKGKGKPYGPTGYYGRGYVQLTWDYNYRKAGTELGVDLIGHPALALDPKIAANVMFRGMTEGWFTGKKLSNYFGVTINDPVNARRIINGTDCADLIAGYHKIFFGALILQAAAPVAVPTSAQPVPVAPVPPVGTLPEPQYPYQAPQVTQATSAAPVTPPPAPTPPASAPGFWGRFFGALSGKLH